MVLARYLMRRWSYVRENATARDIIFKFMANAYPGLPVVNNDREIVGIVTEFDILSVIQKGRDLDSVTAAEIMSKKIVTAGLDTPQEELIKIMMENNFTIIPILKDNRLAGIVSRMEIMNAQIDPDLYKHIE